MRRLPIFALLLLLMATASPVMACLNQGAMSPRESACCQTMHGRCGDMVKMGCCRTEVRTANHPQIAPVTPSTKISFIVVDRSAHVSQSLKTWPSYRFVAPDEHSPPGLLAASTIILRI